jgi:hypothetical protein
MIAQGSTHFTTFTGWPGNNRHGYLHAHATMGGLPAREIMLLALSRLGKDAPIEFALDKDPRIRAVAAYTLQALDVPAETLAFDRHLALTE